MNYIFDNAPTGLYSKVQVAIDGHLINNSVGLSGTVEISGNAKPFMVHARNPFPVSLDMSKMLAPGDPVRCGVAASAIHLFDASNGARLPATS